MREKELSGMSEDDEADVDPRKLDDLVDHVDTPEEARARELLKGLGFCGHYMHFHGGGRSGKQPILCLLAKHGGELSQQRLRSFFELKPGSLSEILNKLEVAGLIERTRNPKDRRQLSVRLTPMGRREAARDQAARIEFRKRAFTCLSAQEQEQMIEMLQKIRVRWEELDG